MGSKGNLKYQDWIFVWVFKNTIFIEKAYYPANI
jgi:hypothetical protein